MAFYKSVGVVAAIVLAGLSITASGETSEVTEFERKAKSLGESISSETAKESKHCSELRQNVEQLKGKPQRRYTAKEVYESECIRNDAPAYGSTGIIGQE